MSFCGLDGEIDGLDGDFLEQSHRTPRIIGNVELGFEVRMCELLGSFPQKVQIAHMLTFPMPLLLRLLN